MSPLNIAALSIMWVTLLASPLAAEDASVDFSDRLTPTCEVKGISVAPPDGWIAVTVDYDESIIRGCEMMLIEDEILLGMLRFSSVKLPPDLHVPAHQALAGLEAEIVRQRGYEISDIIWRKEELPVSGEGFSDGSATGFSAAIEDNPLAQEVHLLTFRSDDTHYALTLLTPARSVEDGRYYDKLIAGLSTVMGSMVLVAEAP